MKELEAECIKKAKATMEWNFFVVYKPNLFVRKMVYSKTVYNYNLCSIHNNF